MGVKYKLPARPTRGRHGTLQGQMSRTSPAWRVRDAEKPIVELLEANGALLKHEPFRHSYPHCWRHKTPIIFRATTQWFIAMDRDAKVKTDSPGKTLREIALHAIGNTRFYPEWGRSRLTAMIQNRPDWTLSRQRNWGTPLPFFLDRQTDELHPDTGALLEKAAAMVDKGGVEAWFAATCEDFGVDPARYRKITDTVDVWFDSGTTHFTVLRKRDRRAVARGPLPRRLRPASRVVPVEPAHGLHHGRPRALRCAPHARLRRRRPGPQDVQVAGQRDLAAEGLRHAGRGGHPPLGRVDGFLRRALHSPTRS